jgi:NADPH-dependent 2,4-dienoyl-CoA reductase/sulfur reductase-like enzyme
VTLRRITSPGDLAEGYDLVVVGAGPAGMEAARIAASHGLDVLVADENRAPGGQIYRGITTARAADLARLGRDYAAGAGIAEAFARSSATYAPGTTVWSVTPSEPETSTGTGLDIGISLAGAATFVNARHVVVASGAIERPLPVPGWTLPGVMTAGAAQIALKTAGLVPEGRTIIAGTGPLLYLLAAQLLRAGATITAVLDTTPRGNWRAALPHALDFLRSAYARKGVGLVATVARGTRVFRGMTDFSIHGTARLDSVVMRRGSEETRIAADLVLLHQGVAPNLNLPLAMGCAYAWDEGRAAFQPTVDEWFGSSLADVSIVGDAAVIVGAAAAALQGAIAGHAVAWRLGKLASDMRDREVAPLRRRLAEAGRGRAFIDRLFRPADRFRRPRGETLVCRCEEVTAARVRETCALGVTGPNQLKAFLRCGMGPCQGRFCGLTVSELIAEERGLPLSEVGYFRPRIPVKPIALAELAALQKSDSAVAAVVGFVETPSPIHETEETP